MYAIIEWPVFKWKEKGHMMGDRGTGGAKRHRKKKNGESNPRSYIVREIAGVMISIVMNICCQNSQFFKILEQATRAA
jgi:hypothetical protein